MVYRLINIALVLLLSGCGFHPHGHSIHSKISQNIVIESGDPYGPFSRALRQELRQAGLTVSDKVDPSAYFIHVNNPVMSTGVTAIRIDGIKAEQQMSLDVNIQFSKVGRAGKTYDLHQSMTYTELPGKSLPMSAAIDSYTNELNQHIAERVARLFERYTQYEASIPQAQ